ncbi:MAG: MarR family transcriptional regulator [Deltaproteobacteria bacterium]|nr:MarR family transcriptional regulator [Deltaproteobacteria bacterium]
MANSPDSTTPRSRSETEEALVDGVIRIVAEVRKRADRMGREHGATMLQIQAVKILHEKGSITISELAQELHLNQSTVSSLVDRMEANGLVRRLTANDDRRKVKLRITEKADDLAMTTPVSPIDMFRQILKPLTGDEMAHLSRMLAKIEKAFFESVEAIDREKPARQKKQSAGG